MSTKRKLPATLARPVVKKSAKAPTKRVLGESRTSVTNAASSLPPASVPETIELSSDSSSDDDDLEEDEDDQDGKPSEQELAAAAAQNTPPLEEDDVRPSLKGQDVVDTEMLSPNGGEGGEGEDDDDLDASDAEPSAPTFGELIRGTIDVASSLAAQQGTPISLAQAHPGGQSLAPPTIASLGTVLNQALRTDDTDLLESCLHTNDVTTVRSTIQRMDSSLAGTLLSKLAARLHRRPGRAHSLMIWIQWTLVSHGGALATHPDIVRQLSALNKVLEERSRGLNSLLTLKGKLDMLESQMQLRKDNRARAASRHRIGFGDDEEEGHRAEDDDDEDAGIIYVEGEEDEALTNGAGRSRDADGDIPLINGIGGDSDEEESDEEDDDDDVLEVVDEESLDEDEVDFDDLDEESGEEDEESEAEDAAPPSKVQKVSKALPKRR